MDNLESIEATENSCFSLHYRMPLYDSFCFANIPATVESLFGLATNQPVLPRSVLGDLWKEWNKIVVVLVDGFGWRFLRMFSELETISSVSSLRDYGVVSRITSLFPSSTTCCDTLMLTGLLPHQTGMVHWQYYDPQIGYCINPFRYSCAGETGKGGLEKLSSGPDIVYPKSPFFDSLKKNQVATSCFYPKAVTTGHLCKHLAETVCITPYESLANGCEMLFKSCKSATTKQYSYLYYDGFDQLLHKCGGSSQEIYSEARFIFDTLEKELIVPLANQKDTLVLITADHGQTDIWPDNHFFLDECAKEIVPLLKKNRSGEPLLGGGGSGCCYLYVQDGYEETVRAVLEDRIGHIAEVHHREELISAGVYGCHDFTPDFLARLGNLVVLQHDHAGIFWKGNEKQFIVRNKGDHGGMTPDEMETILIAVGGC